MNPSLTVVLPIHNQERCLRTLIWRILDLADSMNKNLQIVVIDDASTDDTFDVACELARSIPQVQVFRQPSRLGLKAALDRAGRELNLASAIVHDGASAVDFRQLASLIDGGRETDDAGTPIRELREAASRRVSSLADLNARMQQAHSAITSFRWMRVGGDSGPLRGRRTPPSLAAIAAPHAGPCKSPQ